MATKKDYSKLSKEELIEEIKKLQARKKYGLVWEDKPEDVVVQCKKKLPVLEEVENKAIISDEKLPTNLIIEGDNYHALSVLNYTHQGKIDVIYIDPPYNTGEKDFKYNDTYVDKEDTYRHSKWLSFLSKRLNLAQSLLSETGVIIIHIDEHEVENLGSLLNVNIFGEDNSLGVIVWNKQNPKGDAQGVAVMHEYIYCYAKNKNEFLKLNDTLKRPKPNAEKILRKAKNLFSKLDKTFIPDEIKEVIKPFNYPKEVLKDFEVKYDLFLINKEFQNWLSRQPFSNGEKAYKFIDENGEVYRGVSMAWPNKEIAPDDYFIPLIHPKTKKPCPVPARGWRNPTRTMQKLLEKGLILFGVNENKQPERKYLLKDNLFENTPSIFEYGSSDDDYFNKIGINFPYAKPMNVSKYLLSAIHPNANTILDFFAGSGTAGHAVLQMNKEKKDNKTFILCTNNDNSIAEDITYPRIKAVIKGYEDAKGIPSNVRYFKTSFVSKSKVSDDTRNSLVRKSVDMICVRENTFDKVLDKKEFKIYRSHSLVTGILFDIDEIDAFKQELNKIATPAHIYVFSLTNDTYANEFKDLKLKHKLCPIPESILEVYRKLFKE